MSFDSKDIARAKSECDLPLLVSEKVKLKPISDDEWVGLCPFREEKTPSFRVNATRYHCFSCGAHGDAIEWLMNTEQLNFPQAIRRLGAKEFEHDKVHTQEVASGNLMWDDPEVRKEKCRKKLPANRLILALIWSRIPPSLQALSSIHVNARTTVDEIEIISRVFDLPLTFLGEMTALKIWEDLVAKYFTK